MNSVSPLIEPSTGPFTGPFTGPSTGPSTGPFTGPFTWACRRNGGSGPISSFTASPAGTC
ncbi:hypothetical protein GCM10010485_76460 [Streptosporangium carneum]